MGGFSGFVSGLSGGGGGDAIKKLKSKFKQKKGPGGADSGTNAASSGETEGGGLGVPAMKKGGPIKKTRTYLLHKGERVLNKSQAKRYSRKRG
jgi:hypothetical protein